MSPARFDQHFLVNAAYQEKIIEAVNLKSTDTILEIGPGNGALTQWLVSRVQSVLAVEIDEKRVNDLNSKFGTKKNLKVLHQDFLEMDLDQLESPGNSIKVVGNLPYSITSPILNRLGYWSGWKEATLMVQKEVGNRLTAEVGTKSYGGHNDWR